MSFFENNSVFFNPLPDGEGPHGFNDKRNRNPNWTDHEIVRFLEILQEEDTMKDLMAQRNKQVFCYVAQRMCSEGADKTWDQCRIKLKNLKSQYRYVKDRIPNIDDLDLEDDDVVKELIAKCQGRGISPSSIKHLRFLKRFLSRQSSASFETSRSSSPPPASQLMNCSTSLLTNHPTSPLRKILLTKQQQQQQQPHHVIIPQKAPGFSINRTIHIDGPSQDEESVSPPSTPLPSQSVKIISSSADSRNLDGESEFKRSRLQEAFSMPTSNGVEHGDLDTTSDGYKHIERFNRDMMDQFLDFQRRSQSSFIRWEQERVRQEHLALERWRQEAREHEKQLFGMFCHAMAQCNAALTTMLRSSTAADSAGCNKSDFSNVKRESRKRVRSEKDEVDDDDDDDDDHDIINDDNSNDAEENPRENRNSHS